MATRDVARGEAVRRYGQVIGFATRDIAKGEHPHIQNLAMAMNAGFFAVNWVLNNAAVTGVIGGPRTLEQWQDYVKALEFKYEQKGEALVNAVVSIDHPSTPGYNDPRYPLTGLFSISG